MEELFELRAGLIKARHERELAETPADSQASLRLLQHEELINFEIERKREIQRAADADFQAWMSLSNSLDSLNNQMRMDRIERQQRDLENRQRNQESRIIAP